MNNDEDRRNFDIYTYDTYIYMYFITISDIARKRTNVESTLLIYLYHEYITI